jgi:hypothetical protein
MFDWLLYCQCSTGEKGSGRIVCRQQVAGLGADFTMSNAQMCLATPNNEMRARARSAFSPTFASCHEIISKKTKSKMGQGAVGSITCRPLRSRASSCHPPSAHSRVPRLRLAAAIRRSASYLKRGPGDCHRGWVGGFSLVNTRLDVAGLGKADG